MQINLIEKIDTDKYPTFKDQVDYRYSQIGALKKIQSKYEELEPEEFLKLILIAYQISLSDKDIMNLAKIILQSKAVTKKKISVVRNLNFLSLSHFMATVLCASNFILKPGEIHTTEELQELVNLRKVVIFDFEAKTGTGRDYKRPQFTGLASNPLEVSCELYAKELVYLIKKVLPQEKLASDLLNLIAVTKMDVEMLKTTIDREIKKSYDKAVTFMAEVDKGIIDLDKYNKMSLSLSRTLQEIKDNKH
ncbi:MAG: hypothetical protein NC483_06240 [Ruminococcus sp.]|nr:hypothetical protein [Ruminococcus sp.]